MFEERHILVLAIATGFAREPCAALFLDPREIHIGLPSASAARATITSSLPEIAERTRVSSTYLPAAKMPGSLGDA
jgi:hypothetical protein